jgi:hypothetical protein
VKRPVRDCGQLEAVLWLSGGLLFLGGIVVAVLSVKPWRWL